MKSKFMKVSPILVAISIPLAAVIFVLIFSNTSKKSIGVSKGNDFPVESYLQNPKGFANNTYTLEGQADALLDSVNETGRLITFKTPIGKRVVVFLPSDLDVNIMTGQKYSMDVQLDSKGKITAKKMRKF